MKKRAGLLLQVLLVSSLGAAEADYGLPVKLGLSTGEVRKVLGAPTEGSTQGETASLESYYSHGMVGEFEHDRLVSLTLYKDTNFLGFVPYEGTIVNGVKLSDKRAAVLKKLGPPAKVETEKLPEGTDPNLPERWPLESKYYWQFKDYDVQATFLNQAQAVSYGVVWRNAGIAAAWPKDTLTEITIQRRGAQKQGSAHQH